MQLSSLQPASPSSDVARPRHAASRWLYAVGTPGGLPSEPPRSRRRAGSFARSAVLLLLRVRQVEAGAPLPPGPPHTVSLPWAALL